MIEAAWDEGFKRSYNKRIKNNPMLKKKFWSNLTLFLSDPFAQKLKTHKLGGKLIGLWAFSVDDDCRIIFEFINEGNAVLIDIGKHDEVY
jgi:mRNA-degrading endonuclease YafQ of YafQ-DinJ toxin-antitoxin module